MNRLLLHLNRLLRTATPFSDAQLLALFIQKRDEEAFRLLVERHGPLVRGVCRRWLPNPADRDDAFQATFLVLARKAKSISQPERLSSWLHSVALRTARKLRFSVDRRKRLEELRGQLPDCAVTAATPTSDLARLLDEELARLPEKYRQSVLLCHVQGLSRREAASRLEIPEGTLSTWLNQARLLLRKRLVRRGIVPAVAVPLLLVTEADAVPPELLSATVQAAATFSNPAAMAVASAAVVRLAQGVLRMLLLKRLTAASAALVLVFFLGASIGLFLNEQARRPSYAADPPKLPGKADGLQVQVFESGNKLPQITVVEKEDRITVNSVAALGRYLKRLRAADKSLPDSITIVSNADTKYSTMAEVIFTCKDAGFGVQVASKPMDHRDVGIDVGAALNSDAGLSGTIVNDKLRMDVLTRLEELQRQRDVLLTKLRELEEHRKNEAATDANAELARLRAERDQAEAMLKQAEAYFKEILAKQALPATTYQRSAPAQAKNPPSMPPAVDKSALIEEAKANVAIAEAGVQAARADLDSAVHSADYYKIQMQQAADLWKKGTISQPEMQKAEYETKRALSDIENKKAQVKKAEAELQLARSRLDILKKGGQLPEKNKAALELQADYAQAIKEYERALAEKTAKQDEAKLKELDELKAKQKVHTDQLIKDYDKAIGELATQLDKAKLHKLAETWRGSTKKELEPFQGLWKVTELLYDGKHAPGKLPDLEWIILDDNLVILIEGADARMGKIHVVSPADRKGELSVRYSSDNGTTFSAGGTYEWQGDKLKLTLLPESRPGSPKPAAETALLQRVGRAKESKPESPEIPKIHTPFPVPLAEKGVQMQDAELRVAKAEAEILAVQADLKAAEANFKTNQLKLERMAKLAEEKAVEARLVDEAKVQAEAARAAVDAAQAKVRIAELNLAAEKDNLKRKRAKELGVPEAQPPAKP